MTIMITFFHSATDVKWMRESWLIILVAICTFQVGNTQHSVARQWNDVLLEAIRNDLARPTVHARNLWHTSVLMYDAWAAYETEASTYFLGNPLGDYMCDLESIFIPEDLGERRLHQQRAISYAVKTLLESRFKFSPGYLETMENIESLFAELGFEINYEDTDYEIDSSGAALGNYLGQCMINFGFQDGSNEQSDYRNRHYQSVNPPLVIKNPGNPDILEPNRWQPISLDIFIDQGGNEIPVNTPDFLSPEWGDVFPFALTDEDVTLYERDGNTYRVYHDPGPPPSLGTAEPGFLPDEYKWGFALVAVWSSHLDPSDGVMWDISPRNIGNITDLPTDFEDHRSFYNLLDGGDPSLGWDVNPVTGEPYEIQMVPRGDYARVLAEFWADGPDSETPPGHWFVILNKVMDDPDFERTFMGREALMDTLEYDVKAYFILGGTMHDVAITSWGIKGWYDYIRPVSAIRYMASKGQSSDPGGTSYHANGIPLIRGYIEVVEAGDSLALIDSSNIGKIKLYAWRGPDFIEDPDTDQAGVGWILADNWWPYQRPSFVTPPFAGYVSGHSTYSRAAAEIMTALTGSMYFPGGVGEFEANKNEFLVFEEGPSVDLVLQWATYQDASDQTSLSRLWGGIHPPADDIPGRIIGIEIAEDVVEKALDIFGDVSTSVNEEVADRTNVLIYPNPAQIGGMIQIKTVDNQASMQLIQVMDLQARVWRSQSVHNIENDRQVFVDLEGLPPGIYVVRVSGKDWDHVERVIVVENP